MSALEALADFLLQHDVAKASRSSLQEGNQVSQRAAASKLMPELGKALAEGDINVKHLDAAAGVLGGAKPEQKAELAKRSSQWAKAATNLSIGDFRRFADKELKALEADDGLERLERQKRDCRLSTWTDPATGMVCGRFRLDPEAGGRLLGKVRNTVEAMFHDTQPDTCPIDPIERQHHLQALALMALIDGQGVAGGRPEVCVVIELDTLRSRIRDHSTFYVSDDVDLPVDRCTIHHLDPWEAFGPSDLVNMRPTCSRHHHALHEGGWKVQGEGWSVVVILPDGTQMATRPPLARAG